MTGFNLAPRPAEAAGTSAADQPTFKDVVRGFAALAAVLSHAGSVYQQTYADVLRRLEAAERTRAGA